MNQSFILSDGTKVHYYQTDKFKTITIRLIFKDYLVKEDYMKRWILSSMLSKSNKKYPEENEFSRYLHELYSMNFSTYFTSRALVETFNIGINIINHKYIKEDINLIRKAFELSYDVLNNADITIDKFNLEVNLLKSQICGNMNKRQYAYKKYRELMFDTKLEDYDNNKEDLINQITFDEIVEYYQSLKKRNCEILIIGDITEDEIKEAYKGFNFTNENNRNSVSISRTTNVQNFVFVDQPKIVIESSDTKQSQLCIGYRTNVLFNIKERYALTTLINMLGGDTYSTLYKEIREKRSLAYSISVREDTSKSVFIHTSISSSNYDEVIKVINQVIDDYKKGNIDPNLLDLARIGLTSGTIIEYDRPSYYMENLFTYSLGGETIPLEERIKIANELTIEDIRKVSEKLTLSVSYFLKGEL